jgi:Protein of Unknown function (DUF2784)
MHYDFPMHPALATMLLTAYVLVILFNVGGLVAIPVGSARNAPWVRNFWWRAAHVVSLAAVAGQALAGRACFLTIWQDRFSADTSATPLVARWVNRLIYWPLPLWVFTAVYVAVWIVVLWLWFRVPPRAPLRRNSGGQGMQNR